MGEKEKKAKKWVTKRLNKIQGDFALEFYGEIDEHAYEEIQEAIESALFYIEEAVHEVEEIAT